MQVPLQLQVTGTGRTTMIDASPTMTVARLSRVIAAQTGVPRGSFALYHGSKPMNGRLKDSGVASGSTVELKFRGRGGGPEPQARSTATTSATNSMEVELELGVETEPRSSELQQASVGFHRAADAHDGIDVETSGGGMNEKANVTKVHSDAVAPVSTAPRWAAAMATAAACRAATAARGATAAARSTAAAGWAAASTRGS